MKKILLPLLLFFSLAPLVASAQLSTWFADTLQGLLNQRGKLYNLKSGAAAIQFPDGSVWEGAYGMCGDDPTSSDFLFEMGSNTKTYVATMILQLADEGKLKLDDTLYKFLPAHPNIAHGITIRQLLNHTSGIANYTESPQFDEYMAGDIKARVDIDTVLKYWVEPMLFTPGSKWSYSNTNYMLLGMIIEELDGVPFQEALRTRLLDKFGFKESFLDTYEPYTMTKASTWLSNGSYLGENFESFMSAAWAAGAIITTPRDLAKWARKLYRGDILPNHWLDSMKVGVNAGGNTKYGLGAFMYPYNGKQYIGHGGTTLQNSEMEYSISSDFSCVTVLNVQGTGGQAGNIQRGLVSLVEKLLPKALSVEEAPDYAFSVYPNPVNNQFTISLDNNFLVSHPGSKVNIYSVTGALMKTVEVTQPHLVIYRDNLPSGMYLVNIADTKGNISYRTKLVVQ